MARVEIVKFLVLQIKKNSKYEANKIIELIQTLEESPQKGKLLGNVGSIVIKELKYGGFRFYFITDGFKLKCISSEGLTDLLLRFVRMSNKNEQQKIIEGIKSVLKQIGPASF